MVTYDDAQQQSNDRTDWPRVRAMTDADIQHDTDSPRTTAADWEGAVLKEGGVVVGHTLHANRIESCTTR
jgi:hypothetical protein